MRKILITVVVVAAVLAGLVSVLTLTPVGLRVGLRLVEKSLEERTGLDVTVGGVGGRLVSQFDLSQVSLSLPDGSTFLSIDSAQVTYDPRALVLRRELLAGITLEGVDAVFEMRDDGLVGWKELGRLSSGERAPDTTGGTFSYDVELSTRSAAATYSDTASGTWASCLFDADASLLSESFEAALEGTVSVRTPALAGQYGARLAAYVGGEGGRLDIKGVSVASLPVSVDGSGTLTTATGAPPVVSLSGEAHVNLEALSTLLSAERLPSGLSGSIDVSAAVDGPADSLSYHASVSSQSMSVGGVEVHELAASLLGAPSSVTLERLTAGVLGGSVRADGRVTFGPAGADGEAGLEAEGLELADLAGLGVAADRQGPALGGTLSLTASVKASGLDPGSPSLSALAGAARGNVGGLTVNGRSLGELAFEAALVSETASADLHCCATDVSGEASLAGGDPREASFSISCEDLSVPSGTFGVDGIEGALSAGGVVRFGGDVVTANASISIPSGSWRGKSFAPVEADVAWSGASGEADFTALGGVVTGTADFTSEWTYDGTVDVSGLDLATVIPDSVLDAWQLRGAVSARASVSGDTGAVRSAEGEVRALSLTARGHSVSLDAPFTFRADQDTVEVSHVALTSDLGWISVYGHLARGSQGRIAARFRQLDIAGMAELAPGETVPPLEGRIDGTVSVEGDLARPNVAADLSVDGFSAAGVDFDSVSLSAESDTSDLVFDLEASSAGAGRISATGSFPMDTSRGTVPSFDRRREFALSLVCDGLEFDAGDYLMPTIRGDRLISASGSVLVTGRADSLDTINGRGSFDRLGVTFDLLGFSIADTLDFDLDGGAITLAPTTIAITRRRVLNDEGGGSIVLSGTVAGDGALSASAAVRGVQVARLLRTFAPRSGAPMQGDLELDVSATGTVSQPLVDVMLRVGRPVISGLAFTDLSGSARYENGLLSIADASLRSGKHSLDVRGTVTLPESKSRDAVPGLDLSVATSNFDLGTIRLVDSRLSRVVGMLSADVHVSGPSNRPSVQGELTLRKGAFRGYGLEQPLEHISADIVADGHTVALNDARLSAGDGTVSTVGFLSFGGDGGETFLLKSKLDGAHIVSRGMFDAKFSGNLQWAGSERHSQLSGAVYVEDASISYDVGLSDVLQRRPVRVTVRRSAGALNNATLDLEVNIRDKLAVENGLAKFDVTGGVHLGGALYSPSVSGGFYAEDGSFRFLENEFKLETLSVAFTDPRRSDPYIDLTGTSNVSDRAGEEYVVTVKVQGFARDAVPELTSDPALSEPDIVSLLTFGDTAATLVGGGEAAGSSGDAFGSLARSAFISRAFGIAESALERLLRLDTVSIDDAALKNGNAAATDVTFGKEFGGLLRVNYTTAVGRLDEHEIEVSLEFNKYLALESRADPEGDHAIDVRLRIPFR